MKGAKWFPKSCDWG